MTYEEEILAKNSTASLRRNILPRSAKKLNMEFDANYAHMSRTEQNEFLDKLYLEDIQPKEPPHEPESPDVRRPGPAGGTDRSEKAAAEAGEAR